MRPGQHPSLSETSCPETRECQECGETIDPKRLAVRPETEICVECQRKREKTGQFKRARIETTSLVEGWEHAGTIDHFIPGTL